MAWRAVFKDTNSHCGWSIMDGHHMIATVYAHMTVVPRPRGGLAKLQENLDSIRNATMMAAAPELLAALLEVRRQMYLRPNETWQRVDAALQKAGYVEPPPPETCPNCDNAMPKGCGGLFKNEGVSCFLNRK